MNVSPGSTKMSEAKTKTKRRDVLVDIRIRREVLWVTTNIDRVLGLIHPNPVNPHLRRERQVVGIDEASKVSRHAQVHDEVLSESNINQKRLVSPAPRREITQQGKYTPSAPAESASQQSLPEYPQPTHPGSASTPSYRSLPK